MKKSQSKFLFYFAVIFLITFVLLYLAGFVPKVLKPDRGDSFRTLWDKSQTDRIKNQQAAGLIVAENPTRIVIDKIGVDSTISNPNTTNIATLDEYLKQGAVHYPGSGLIGQGNMFLFGHSSNLAVVNNQAYRAFNGLKDLRAGDLIKVYGSSKVYTYRVSSVTLVDEHQALVEFNQSKNMLTLSTCNTFGKKSERYVVEADYISAL